MKRLESKVMKVGDLVKQDLFGKYIPICCFERHYGIIIREEVCLERQCKHYDKFYLIANGDWEGIE